MSQAEPITPSPHPGRNRPLPALLGPALGLVVVVVVFVALTAARGVLGRFANLDNLHVLAHTNTLVAVAALGMLMIIVSGGIDLSVGSVVALVTVVTMWVYTRAYAGPSTMAAASVAAVAAGVLTGALCGLANGVVITAFRLPPFVATLGMMTIARGLAYTLADKKVISFPMGGRPDWLDVLSRPELDPTSVATWLRGLGLPDWLGAAAWWVVRVAGFNLGFWLLQLLAVAVAVLLRRTVLGRYTYAVGSNEATARLCGIPVGGTRILTFVLAGLLFGVAGIMSFANLGIGDPGGNIGLELKVIAVVVIGGARLTGGQGTVAGTLLGVLILGVLDSGVAACAVPAEVQHILIGIIIIAMMALSQRKWFGARA